MIALTAIFSWHPILVWEAVYFSQCRKAHFHSSFCWILRSSVFCELCWGCLLHSSWASGCIYFCCLGSLCTAKTLVLMSTALMIHTWHTNQNAFQVIDSQIHIVSLTKHLIPSENTWIMRALKKQGISKIFFSIFPHPQQVGAIA